MDSHILMIFFGGGFFSRHRPGAYFQIWSYYRNSGNVSTASLAWILELLEELFGGVVCLEKTSFRCWGKLVSKIVSRHMSRHTPFSSRHPNFRR